MPKTIIPQKLKPGDEIRIVALAASLAILSKQTVHLATDRLKSLGLRVTFGKHVREKDSFESSSIKSRIADLHDAFSDKNVKAILAVIGGFNSNQLLPYLDFGLIRRNPKILCGFSDITALQNAIFAKTGLVTYSGPAFASFGRKNGFEYSLNQFAASLISSKPLDIPPATHCGDYPSHAHDAKPSFHKNKGPWTIAPGTAQGTIIGANLCTLNLLQGTPFMPSLRNSILFMEDDHESKAVNFDRDLTSLAQLPDFGGVKGIVIGQFQKASGMTRAKLMTIIKTKREINGIPVIADANFGHTKPIFTFPVGGTARIEAKRNSARIIILRH